MTQQIKKILDYFNYPHTLYSWGFQVDIPNSNLYLNIDTQTNPPKVAIRNCYDLSQRQSISEVRDTLAKIDELLNLIESTQSAST